MVQCSATDPHFNDGAPAATAELGLHIWPGTGKEFAIL
jgi:hypothetical protein